MARKGFREKLLMGFPAVAVSFMLAAPCSMPVYAGGADGEPAAWDGDTDEGGGIALYSAIIEYRYKAEGTKLYRRLYNYTEQCWVGDWEFIGEGYIRPDA